MTPLLFVGAAALGAGGRLLLASFVCSWQALLLANVCGSALLGAVLTADLSAGTVTVIGVAFCGTLTTFSSFALEVRRLGLRWGGAYAALTVGCACGAASIAASLVTG